MKSLIRSQMLDAIRRELSADVVVDAAFMLTYGLVYAKVSVDRRVWYVTITQHRTAGWVVIPVTRRQFESASTGREEAVVRRSEA